MQPSTKKTGKCLASFMRTATSCEKVSQCASPTALDYWTQNTSSINCWQVKREIGKDISVPNWAVKSASGVKSIFVGLTSASLKRFEIDIYSPLHSKRNAKQRTKLWTCVRFVLLHFPRNTIELLARFYCKPRLAYGWDQQEPNCSSPHVRNPRAEFIKTKQERAVNCERADRE